MKSTVYPRDQDKALELEDQRHKSSRRKENVIITEQWQSLDKYSNKSRKIKDWKRALKWIQPTLKCFQWNSWEKEARMQVDLSENAWQILLLKLNQRVFHFLLRPQTIEMIMEITETASCWIPPLIHQLTLNFSKCLDTS